MTQGLVPFRLVTLCEVMSGKEQKTSEEFPGEHQTFNYQMEKLRREVRELGRLIAKESGLERLVEWLNRRLS